MARRYSTHAGLTDSLRVRMVSCTQSWLRSAFGIRLGHLHSLICAKVGTFIDRNILHHDHQLLPARLCPSHLVHPVLSLIRVHLLQVGLTKLILITLYACMFIADALYSPSTPVSLVIPSGGICGDDLKIVLVGSVPEDSEEFPEMIITGPNETEALHIKIGVVEDVVWRWAVLTNVSVENVGSDGDGMTIDFGEPFLIT